MRGGPAATPLDSVSIGDWALVKGEAWAHTPILRADGQVHRRAADDERVRWHRRVGPILAAPPSRLALPRLDRSDVGERQHDRRLLHLALGVRRRPAHLVDVEVALRPSRAVALVLIGVKIRFLLCLSENLCADLLILSLFLAPSVLSLRRPVDSAALAEDWCGM